MRFLLIFACVTSLAGSLFAQEGARLSPPTLPKGVYAHWQSGKALKKGGDLTLVDLVGVAHLITSDDAYAVAPSGGGVVVDGSQAAEIRPASRQPIGNRFVMGVDVRFDDDGAEHQTVAYLFRFAEFRYRKSRGELTFNVWQAAADSAGTEVVTSVRLPLPPGKWARVRGVIEDGVARLEVDGTKAEAKLLGTWELLPQTSTLLVGKGGADRVFKGRFDHLYLALTP